MTYFYKARGAMVSSMATAADAPVRILLECILV